MKYEKLFTPWKINGLEIKNRIVMPSMVANYCNPEGSVTERYINYLEARARGGVGLIMTEAAYINQAGKGMSNELGIQNDALLPGHKELAERIHRCGAKLGIQLNHVGRSAFRAITGVDVVSASDFTDMYTGEAARALTKEEIAQVLDDFGQAARRVKEMGADAVEIHGAHGYLIQQFLSPFINKRTDEYGGSWENRIRFPLEVLKRVRDAVGKDFPIIFRISSDEFIEGGLNLEDMKKFSRLLVENGIDALHVSAGLHETTNLFIASEAMPQGFLVSNAHEIRKAIEARVPVLTVGRIKNADMAEEILEQEKADAICMGRPLIADEELPNKIQNGNEALVRKCIACNQGCLDRLIAGDSISCVCNPLNGHEGEYDMTTPAQVRKNIAVIGSGPAGMEAARVAAIKGHRVTLFEAENHLGGHLALAAIPPCKQELNDFRSFLENSLEYLGVNIRMGTAADSAMIQKGNFDAVIIATGAVPSVPPIPGVDRANVVTADDVLAGKAKTGKNAVVIGGGLVGCETAEFISKSGASVTVVEMLDDVAKDMGFTRSELLMRMQESNIRTYVNTTVKSIGDGQVTLNDGRDDFTLDNIDTVVLAVGYKANRQLAEALTALGIRTYVIGDSADPRRIRDAVQEGFKTAYAL